MLFFPKEVYLTGCNKRRAELSLPLTGQSGAAWGFGLWFQRCPVPLHAQQTTSRQCCRLADRQLQRLFYLLELRAVHAFGPAHVLAFGLSRQVLGAAFLRDALPTGARGRRTRPGPQRSEYRAIGALVADFSADTFFDTDPATGRSRFRL